MRKRVVALLSIVGAGWVGACGDAPAPEPGTLVWGDTAPGVAAGVEGNVQAGRLTVRRAPDADGTLTIQVVRFEGVGARGSPIIYLPPRLNRPAAEVLSRRPGHLLDSLRTRADVIAVDPRGVGESGPAPHVCAEFAWPFEGHGAPEEDWVRGIGRACADSARAAGIEPEAVGVTATARDLDAFRAALGVPRITLVAEGAGAAIAAAYAAIFPRTVDRVVFLGPAMPGYALDHPAAYARAFALLDAATEGADLGALLDAATDSLEVRVRAGTARDGHLVLISAWDLRRMVVEALRSGTGRDSLPEWLRGTAAAEWSALAEYTHRARQSRPLRLAELASACSVIALASGAISDEGPTALDADATAGAVPIPRDADATPDAGSGTPFHDAVPWPYPALCAGAGFPAGGPAAREDGLAAELVPGLVVRGAVDPVASPVSALAAPVDARIVTVDGLAHTEPSPASSEAAIRAVLAFLRR